MTAHLHQLFAGKPAFEATDAARFGQRADAMIGHGHAEPAEFAAVEPRGFVAEHLLQDQRTDEMADGETIGFGLIVNMVRRDEADGAGHVFDQSGRITGNMFAEMARDGAGVNIEPTARFVGDDEANGFAAVKIVLGEGGKFSQENAEHE